MTEINAIASGNTTAIDHSFSQYDAKSGPNVGVGTMSFDDFLDMINPLQHIPVVSSIYRAVTGDTVNPVARIAGDTLYGAALGVATAGVSVLASAGVAAIGAIGDEVFTANNSGKSAAGTVVAALFGSDDSDKTTQLASNDEAATPAPAPTSDPQTQSLQVAALQTPAKMSPILQMPDLSSAPAQVAAATASPSTTSTPSATATAIEAGKSFALDRSKLPYGGIMDSATMQSALQNQALALSMASGQDNMQAQHTLRNSRFATSTASPTTATTAQSASLPLPGDTSLASLVNPTAAHAGAGANPASTIAAAQGLPPSMPSAASLRQSLPGGDLRTIKSLDQYRQTSQRVPMPAVGGALDVTN